MDSTRDYARVSHSRQWSNYNVYHVTDVATILTQETTSVQRLVLIETHNTRQIPQPAVVQIIGLKKRYLLKIYRVVQKTVPLF